MMSKNRWTSEETKLLVQAVENGRKEGKNNQQIAQGLVDHFPNHPYGSIYWMISQRCPQRRHKHRKTPGLNGIAVKVNRVERLLEQRNTLTAELATVKKKLNEVEEELRGLIN